MLPFFPGIPNSQDIRFIEPSPLLMGLGKVERIEGLLEVVEHLAMKPKGWSFLQDLRSSERRCSAIPDILDSHLSENLE